MFMCLCVCVCVCVCTRARASVLARARASVRACACMRMRASRWGYNPIVVVTLADGVTSGGDVDVALLRICQKRPIIEPKETRVKRDLL